MVDAFCGAGGFALGLRLAADVLGIDAHFSTIVDTDAGALQVHAANLGAKTVLHDSVRSLVDYQLRGPDDDITFAYPPEIVAPTLTRLQPTDILIAGPPCQGHSNLNNHSRRRDPRNDHFLTAVAFGIALGARAILIENVPTVQNAHGDVVRVAETLLRTAGYCVSAAVLRAERLGAAQARARFFMLAVAADPIADAIAVDWLRQFALAREASRSRLLGQSGISSIASRTPSSTAPRSPPRQIADGSHGSWRMMHTIFLGTSALTVIVTVRATLLYTDVCTAIAPRRRSRQASALRDRAVSSIRTGRVSSHRMRRRESGLSRLVRLRPRRSTLYAKEPREMDR